MTRRLAVAFVWLALLLSILGLAHGADILLCRFGMSEAACAKLEFEP